MTPTLPAVKKRSIAVSPSERRRDARGGAITVELAFTAPLLFLVFFASVEFSRLNVIKNTLENAAYEGCRQGILPGASEAKCKNAAQQILQTIGISDASVVVTPSTIATDSPQVTVDIGLTLLPSHGFIFNRFVMGHSLQASCTLQREIMDGT